MTYSNIGRMFKHMHTVPQLDIYIPLPENRKQAIKVIDHYRQRLKDKPERFTLKDYFHPAAVAFVVEREIAKNYD